MKYQIVKRLGRGSRSHVVATFKEALEYLLTIGARFECVSYMGGFPVFTRQLKTRRETYSIQGLHEHTQPSGEVVGIVCGLPKNEVESLLQMGSLIA